MKKLNESLFNLFKDMRRIFKHGTELEWLVFSEDICFLNSFCGCGLGK